MPEGNPKVLKEGLEKAPLPLDGDLQQEREQSVPERLRYSRISAPLRAAFNGKPSSMDRLGGFANFGSRTLAQLTFTCDSTARRWIREGLAPRLVLRSLEIVTRGPLGMICSHWKGWSLRGGKLHSPEGDQFTPDELRAIPLRNQETAALRLRISGLESQLAEANRLQSPRFHCRRAKSSVFSPEKTQS